MIWCGSGVVREGPRLRLESREEVGRELPFGSEQELDRFGPRQGRRGLKRSGPSVRERLG